MWTKWLGALLLASSALAARAQPAPPPAPADVLAIPTALKQQFREQVIDPTRLPHARLERMVDFLFSPQGLGMTYDAAANHTVAQAYATRKANCMSFTLLTVALALEPGSDPAAQSVA